MGLQASISAGAKERCDASPTGGSGRGYPALDGIRGLAAIIVAYYHVTGIATDFQSRMFSHGYLAVDMFFALSGFVMFHAYFDRFRHGLSVRAFVLARLIRLYPLYAIGLLIGVSAHFLVARIDPTQAMPPAHVLSSIVTGLFILPSYPPAGTLFPFNGPCWTLMFELIVNVLMAILWRRITRRGMVLLCAILAAILVVYVIGRGDAAAGDTWSNALFGFVRCAFSFSIGILVHLITHRRIVTPRPQPLLFGVLCLVIASALIGWPPAALSPLYDLVFILMVSPLCILLGSRIVLTGAMVRVCTMLGVTSYALYVTHCPMIRVILLWGDATRQLDARHHLMMIASGYVLGFALLAYALDRLYDAPLRRRLAGMAMPRP